MTQTTDHSSHSLLSKLRQRSAIFFTVLLALSIASFVENLHMGRDAIAFVVAELSRIEGWADAVNAVAAIFHGTLDWWRGVLRGLLSFLPFEIPRWLHDPISVLLLGVTRIWNQRRLVMANLNVSDWEWDNVHIEGLTFQERAVLFLRRILVTVTFSLVIPMIALLFADAKYGNPTWRDQSIDRFLFSFYEEESAKVAVYFLTFITFMFAIWLATRFLRILRARKAPRM